MPTRATHCPRCGHRIYRTHRCRASAFDPEPELVPIPVDFRAQVAEHRPEPQLPLELESETRP